MTIEGSKDAFGDRMKAYEATTTSARFEEGRPVCARIDGRSFSSFTRGMKRPFEEELSHLMQEVTKYLVEETGARCGFTQSDEISLVFLADETPESQIFFGGRQFKIVSGLAALASTRFVIEAMKLWPKRCAERLPTFDARVFQVPDRQEAAATFLWRYLDCERNAIQMVAQSLYEHRDLQGRNIREQLALIEAKGVRMEDLPDFFRHGTFVRRTSELRPLTEEERRSIPAEFVPTEPLPRSSIAMESIPVRRLANLEAFVMDGEVADLSRVQAGWRKEPEQDAPTPMV